MLSYAVSSAALYFKTNHAFFLRSLHSHGGFFNGRLLYNIRQAGKQYFTLLFNQQYTLISFVKASSEYEFNQ